WGLASKVTVVHKDAIIANELIFGQRLEVKPDRAFRFPWHTTRLVPGVDSLEFGTVALGDSATRSFPIRNDSGTSITINGWVADDMTFVANPPPITIGPGASATVNVKYKPNHPVTNATTLYVTASNDTELVAAPVFLRGTGTGTAGA